MVTQSKHGGGTDAFPQIAAAVSEIKNWERTAGDEAKPLAERYEAQVSARAGKIILKRIRSALTIVILAITLSLQCGPHLSAALSRGTDDPVVNVLGQLTDVLTDANTTGDGPGADDEMLDGPQDPLLRLIG